VVVIGVVLGVGDFDVVGDGDVIEKSWAWAASWTIAAGDARRLRRRLFEHVAVAGHVNDHDADHLGAHVNELP